MFNTNDLGYKLRCGSIKKHSEQLNKYVAGFIDSDGCISLKYKEMTTGRYGVYVQFALCQSESNDEGHELLLALQKHYNVGQVYIEREFSKSVAARWVVSGKEAEKFLSVIHKHLLVKYTHLGNILWITRELRGYTIRDATDLKDYMKCSRASSRWKREPKHISKAWLAGFIDGDGHYRVRIGRQRRYRDGSVATVNELKLFLGTQESDVFILRQLCKDYRGSLSKRTDGLWMWQLALGKQSRTKAIDLLTSLRKYTCITKKYNAILRALAFHEQYHLQRLSVGEVDKIMR